MAEEGVRVAPNTGGLLWAPPLPISNQGEARKSSVMYENLESIVTPSTVSPESSLQAARELYLFLCVLRGAVGDSPKLEAKKIEQLPLDLRELYGRQVQILAGSRIRKKFSDDEESRRKRRRLINLKLSKEWRKQRDIDRDIWRAVQARTTRLPIWANLPQIKSPDNVLGKNAGLTGQFWSFCELFPLISIFPKIIESLEIDVRSVDVRNSVSAAKSEIGPRNTVQVANSPPTKDPKKPTKKQYEIYSFCHKGWNQLDAAEKFYGDRKKQYRVSRDIDVMEKWLLYLGSLPDEKKAALIARIHPTDPETLDLGKRRDGLTKRQRLSESQD